MQDIQNVLKYSWVSLPQWGFGFAAESGNNKEPSAFLPIHTLKIP